MSKVLKYIDQIGKPFQFNISGLETFKTSLGGIISIIWLLGIISLFGYFGKDLFEKSNPNFIERIDRDDNYTYTSINNSELGISIGINGDNSSVYNLSYFDMNVYIVTQNYGDITYEEISHIKCTEDSNFKNYCFDFNAVIGGYWDVKTVKYLNYILRRCDKKTEQKYNITCATDEEVNQVLPVVYITIFTQNRLMDPQNYKSPYKKVEEVNYMIYNMKTKQHSDVELFYNGANLTTD